MSVVQLRPKARAWKAAKIDTMRSGWPTWTSPPDVDIRAGLRILRARSRHEAQNNDHARGFLREVKSNVIGDNGVGFQSKARRRSGAPDVRAQGALEDSWAEWCELGSCEVTRRLGWADVQHQCIETVAREGEALYRLVPGWQGNPYRFALEAYDPEVLDVELNEILPTGNRIIMGVELDDFGGHTAYYLIKQEPLHRGYIAPRSREHIRVPAEQMLLIHLPEWVTATRGIPWMATALRRMTDLEGYDESAVVAARTGASNMGFFQQGDEAPPIEKDDGTAENVMIDAEDDSGKLYTNFAPGEIGILPQGWTFAGWDPKYPHAEHGSFTKAVLRGIATGLGVNYNTLANDLEGVSYNSLRHYALVDRAVWKMIQQWIIRSFHTQVYRAWLSTALQAGAILDRRGNALDPMRERDFRRVEWQPRRWQWVDPDKESKSAEREIAMRVRSISSVIRERGDDPEEVWMEIAAEKARLLEMGIEATEAVAAAVAAPPSDDDGEQAGGGDDQ